MAENLENLRHFSADSVKRQIILITGATRSGKSEWAERLAVKMDKPVTYVATALRDTSDLEWENRINQHRLRRPPHWQTLEVPLDLATTLDGIAPHCILIDSLGTWVANLLEQDQTTWEHTTTELLTRLKQSPLDVILVAEEVGWGVVPAYPLGRLFRDRLGTLTRKIGQIADTVYLVTGGYVLNLTQLGQPLG